MTTYQASDRTQPLTAVDQPTAAATAAEPDCGMTETPVVFLIVVPGFGVIEATYDEATADRMTRKLNGVSVALPVVHDYRQTPPIAADVAAFLTPPAAAA